MKPLAADDPRVIGEYRLRARLGAGGMGRVYLGLSPAGRAVAIKVVHPDLATNSEFLRRFGQEVAAARAVSGIYTAPVVASGLNERPPWLATAFVPGPSLDQVIAEHGPLPEQALWPLFGGLVEALQAIHDCRVVHRDLKPPNVLLATDGPRVIDFGISRAADGTSLTQAGVVFGTPGYMSPEQAEGEPAGPASDVFALGCVLAYAATGKGPFGTGTAAAILYRVVHAEPVLDGMPPRLRQVVSRCLVKDPAARPSPRALAGLLADQFAGQLDTTGPSAVSFWPRSVAGLIGAYQARLEQETKADRFSWASPGQGPAGPGAGQGGPGAGQGGPGAGGPGTHPRTAPSDPGAAWPRPAAAPPPRWPYGGGAAASPAPGAGTAQGAGTSPGAGGAPRDAAPPPRGYAAGGTAVAAPPLNMTFPLGAGPARLASQPASVLSAVKLMYAGAASALVYAIGFLAVAGAYVRNHPASHYTVGGLAGGVIFASLVEAGLWVGLARACKDGRNWARITGTVLFGIYTIFFLDVLGQQNVGLTKLLTTVTWVIGCAAVVLLWKRPSSAFFKGRR